MDAEDYSGCAFSLICQEDGADLEDDGIGGGGGGRELFLLYNAGEEEDDDDEEEEYMEQLVSKESSFCSSSSSSSSGFSDAGAGDSPIAAEDWFQRARRAAVKWILETRGCFGFSHRTAYLAIAYFDRFCLRRRVDRAAAPWAAQLLSIACASLAAKMEEYRVPALSEFRADEYEFSCVSIRRMELLVLSTLDWRMGAVTPFDYLPFFSSRLRRDGARYDDHAVAAFKAVGLIFATTEASSVLDYRPSTVAAAAALAASYGTLSKDKLESKMSNLSQSCLLEKEHVHACYSLMVRETKEAASTYDSVSVVDVTDTDASSSVGEAAARNKRRRLALPGIR